MEDQTAQAPAVLNNVLLGLGAFGAALWGLYERVVRMRVEKANNGASVAVSEGTETLFALMKQRLEALEAEVSKLRSELEIERSHRRDTEEYVFELQDLMRGKGIPVPAFKKGTTT